MRLFRRVADFNRLDYMRTHKLTKNDLAGMDKKRLELLRNSLYAYYGYKFQRKDLYEYFSRFSWYQPTISDMATIYKSMSSTEQYNVDFIKNFE